MVIIKLAFIFAFCFFVLNYPSHILAQNEDCSGDQCFINIGNRQGAGAIPGIPAFGNPNANVGTIVSNFVLIMFIAGGLAVLVYFIWGTFDWITAGGDKEKISAARRKIINSFIGLTLLSLSYFLISLFGQIVGYDPLNTAPLPRLDDPINTP